MCTGTQETPPDSIDADKGFESKMRRARDNSDAAFLENVATRRQSLMQEKESLRGARLRAWQPQQRELSKTNEPLTMNIVDEKESIQSVSVLAPGENNTYFDINIVINTPAMEVQEIARQTYTSLFPQTKGRVYLCLYKCEYVDYKNTQGYISVSEFSLATKEEKEKLKSYSDVLLKKTFRDKIEQYDQKNNTPISPSKALIQERFSGFEDIFKLTKENMVSLSLDWDQQSVPVSLVLGRSSEKISVLISPETTSAELIRQVTPQWKSLFPELHTRASELKIGVSFPDNNQDLLLQANEHPLLEIYEAERLNSLATLIVDIIKLRNHHGVSKLEMLQTNSPEEDALKYQQSIEALIYIPSDLEEKSRGPEIVNHITLGPQQASLTLADFQSLRKACNATISELNAKYPPLDPSREESYDLRTNPTVASVLYSKTLESYVDTFINKNALKILQLSDTTVRDFIVIFESCMDHVFADHILLLENIKSSRVKRWNEKKLEEVKTEFIQQMHQVKQEMMDGFKNLLQNCSRETLDFGSEALRRQTAIFKDWQTPHESEYNSTGNLETTCNTALTILSEVYLVPKNKHVMNVKQCLNYYNQAHLSIIRQLARRYMICTRDMHDFYKPSEMEQASYAKWKALELKNIKKIRRTMLRNKEEDRVLSQKNEQERLLQSETSKHHLSLNRLAVETLVHATRWKSTKGEKKYFRGQIQFKIHSLVYKSKKFKDPCIVLTLGGHHLTFRGGFFDTNKEVYLFDEEIQVFDEGIHPDLSAYFPGDELQDDNNNDDDQQEKGAQSNQGGLKNTIPDDKFDIKETAETPSSKEKEPFDGLKRKQDGYPMHYNDPALSVVFSVYDIGESDADMFLNLTMIPLQNLIIDPASEYKPGDLLQLKDYAGECKVFLDKDSYILFSYTNQFDAIPEQFIITTTKIHNLPENLPLVYQSTTIAIYGTNLVLETFIPTMDYLKLPQIMNFERMYYFGYAYYYESSIDWWYCCLVIVFDAEVLVITDKEMIPFSISIEGLQLKEYHQDAACMKKDEELEGLRRTIAGRVSTPSKKSATVGTGSGGGSGGGGLMGILKPKRRPGQFRITGIDGVKHYFKINSFTEMFKLKIAVYRSQYYSSPTKKPWKSYLKQALNTDHQKQAEGDFSHHHESNRNDAFNNAQLESTPLDMETNHQADAGLHFEQDASAPSRSRRKSSLFDSVYEKTYDKETKRLNLRAKRKSSFGEALKTRLRVLKISSANQNEPKSDLMASADHQGNLQRLKGMDLEQQNHPVDELQVIDLARKLVEIGEKEKGSSKYQNLIRTKNHHAYFVDYCYPSRARIHPDHIFEDVKGKIDNENKVYFYVGYSTTVFAEAIMEFKAAQDAERWYESIIKIADSYNQTHLDILPKKVILKDIDEMTKNLIDPSLCMTSLLKKLHLYKEFIERIDRNEERWVIEIEKIEKVSFNTNPQGSEDDDNDDDGQSQVEKNALEPQEATFNQQLARLFGDKTQKSGHEFFRQIADDLGSHYFTIIGQTVLERLSFWIGVQTNFRNLIFFKKMVSLYLESSKGAISYHKEMYLTAIGQLLSTFEELDSGTKKYDLMLTKKEKFELGSCLTQLERYLLLELKSYKKIFPFGKGGMQVAAEVYGLIYMVKIKHDLNEFSPEPLLSESNKDNVSHSEQNIKSSSSQENTSYQSSSTSASKSNSSSQEITQRLSLMNIIPPGMGTNRDELISFADLIQMKCANPQQRLQYSLQTEAKENYMRYREQWEGQKQNEVLVKHRQSVGIQSASSMSYLECISTEEHHLMQMELLSHSLSFITDQIKEDQGYYAQVFDMMGIHLLKVNLESYLDCIEIDLEMLLPTKCIETLLFNIYKKLLYLYQMSFYDKQTKLAEILLVFQPYVIIWVNNTNRKAMRWIHGSIAQDSLEIEEGSATKHSSSVVDSFCVIMDTFTSALTFNWIEPSFRYQLVLHIAKLVDLNTKVYVKQLLKRLELLLHEEYNEKSLYITDYKDPVTKWKRKFLVSINNCYLIKTFLVTLRDNMMDEILKCQKLSKKVDLARQLSSELAKYPSRGQYSEKEQVESDKLRRFSKQCCGEADMLATDRHDSSESISQLRDQEDEEDDAHLYVTGMAEHDPLNAIISGRRSTSQNEKGMLHRGNNTTLHDASTKGGTAGGSGNGGSWHRRKTLKEIVFEVKKMRPRKIHQQVRFELDGSNEISEHQQQKETPASSNSFIDKKTFRKVSLSVNPDQHADEEEQIDNDYDGNPRDQSRDTHVNRPYRPESEVRLYKDKDLLDKTLNSLYEIEKKEKESRPKSESQLDPNSELRNTISFNETNIDLLTHTKALNSEYFDENNLPTTGTKFKLVRHSEQEKSPKDQLSIKVEADALKEPETNEFKRMEEPIEILARSIKMTGIFIDILLSKLLLSIEEPIFEAILGFYVHPLLTSEQVLEEHKKQYRAENGFLYRVAHIFTKAEHSYQNPESIFGDGQAIGESEGQEINRSVEDAHSTSSADVDEQAEKENGALIGPDQGHHHQQGFKKSFGLGAAMAGNAQPVIRRAGLTVKRPPNETIRSILYPKIDKLTELFDKKLTILSEHLHEEVMKLALKKIWLLVLWCFRTLFCPTHFAPKIGRMGPTRPITELQLSISNMAVDALKEYLYADGDGISSELSEGRSYQRTLDIFNFCVLPSSALIRYLEDKTQHTNRIIYLGILLQRKSDLDANEYVQNWTTQPGLTKAYRHLIEISRDGGIVRKFGESYLFIEEYQD